MTKTYDLFIGGKFVHSDGQEYGGFNWSSQHPFDGGVDDKIRQTKVRTFDPGQIKLSGEATSLAT